MRTKIACIGCSFAQQSWARTEFGHGICDRLLHLSKKSYHAKLRISFLPRPDSTLRLVRVMARILQAPQITSSRPAYTLIPPIKRFRNQMLLAFPIQYLFLIQIPRLSPNRIPIANSMRIRILVLFRNPNLKALTIPLKQAILTRSSPLVPSFKMGISEDFQAMKN